MLASGGDTMRTWFGLGLAVAVALACTGCAQTTPDDVMRITLQRGTATEEQASERLATLASTPQEPLLIRMWALRALGRLERHPLATVHLLGEGVAAGRSNDEWTAYAAYTLGQMHRKEAVPYLIRALASSQSPASSHRLLEALGANLKFVLDDVELNQKAVAALHHFASMQSHHIDNMYHLVNEYLSNLVVLAMALEATQKRASQEGAQRGDAGDLYVATQQTLLHILSNKHRYIASFGDKKTQLKRVLDLALSETSTGDEMLWLLTAWYAAALSDNAEFAGLVVRKLVQWLPAAPTSVKLVVVWALARSERYSQAARTALVEGVLAAETDDNVLQLLEAISSESQNLDVFQKALGLTPQAQPSGGGR